MKPFMFVIKGIPLPTNQNFEIVGGANIHIWVMDNNIESAQSRALEYIKSYLWEPITTEYASEISPEQLANLHPAEALLYQKALQYQLAAEFVAYQKKKGQDDDPVVFGRP